VWGNTLGSVLIAFLRRPFWIVTRKEKNPAKLICNNATPQPGKKLGVSNRFLTL
jgi:hypothetical protein